MSSQQQKGILEIVELKGMRWLGVTYMEEKEELKPRGEILNWLWVWILQLERSDSEFSLLVERRQRREKGEGCCEVQSVSVVWVAEREERLGG